MRCARLHRDRGCRKKALPAEPHARNPGLACLLHTICCARLHAAAAPAAPGRRALQHAWTLLLRGAATTSMRLASKPSLVAPACLVQA